MTDEPLDPDDSLDGALARARDAIAAPPEPLDEITRRRLVTRAMAERAPRRAHRPPRRWPAALGAAAAIALVALGGWAVLSTSGSNSKGDSASRAGVSATTLAPSSPGVPTAALGEVSNPRQLLAQVRSALGSTAGRPTDSPASTRAPSVADGRCDPTVKTPAGVAARPLATATYRGAPAVVFVARRGRQTLIYVVDARTCRLLTSQFFQG